MAKNVAVGLLRPPHVFFYEVDCKKGNFKAMRMSIQRSAMDWFESYSLFRTRHGYHLFGYPYSKEAWDFFKFVYPSDFTIKLRMRWYSKNPQVLRISEKWDLKTGKVTSPKPKFICGNFFLDGIMNYKVLYYAK